MLVSVYTCVINIFIIFHGMDLSLLVSIYIYFIFHGIIIIIISQLNIIFIVVINILHYISRDYYYHYHHN